MKFRAVMIDAGPMREFSNLVTIISKLSKECVLRLTDDQLYFIVSEENSGPSPPILWCEIPQAMFCSEYHLIGLDEEHKDIYMALSSGNLARSLVTLKTAKSLKIKLTKKQCPCLTLEIETGTIHTRLISGLTASPALLLHHTLALCISTQLCGALPASAFPSTFNLFAVKPCVISQQTRQVTHDIPVTVIPRKLWSDYHEPRIPDPDISIELPSLKQLRTTIDRMRTMASEVVIRASAEGRLTLQIKTDMAKVSTRFKGLRVEAFGGPIEHSDSETEETQANEDMSRICYCRVDAKKLSMFLSADQISTNRTVCSIVHKKLVILCLQTDENVKLQCFISGIVY